MLQPCPKCHSWLSPDDFVLDESKIDKSKVPEFKDGIMTEEIRKEELKALYESMKDSTVKCNWCKAVMPANWYYQFLEKAWEVCGNETYEETMKEEDIIPNVLKMMEEDKEKDGRT